MSAQLIEFQLQYGGTFLWDLGWNYLYHKTWYKLFLACLMGINDLLQYTVLLYWKTSAWSKGNKDGNPSPHNCCLIIILRCSSRKFLVWLCEETSNNKHGWIPIKYLNGLHHNRTQNQLQHSLQKYYQLPILGTLDISGHFHQKQ